LHCTSVYGHCRQSSVQQPGGGCSAAFGPDGRRLTKEIEPTTEEMLYADLDMDLILGARCFVDACGHYSRPDLLWLGVDDREKTHRVSERMEALKREEKKNLANGTNSVEKARQA